MGFLDKLFGGSKKYPALAPDTSAAKKLKSMKDPLEKLSKDVSETIEIIPAEESAFVFIGKPPKNFGMAWIEDGRVHSFKTLSEEKGVPQNKLPKLAEALANAYRKSDSDDRYSTTIGNKVVTVTPSQKLAKEVQQILASA